MKDEKTGNSKARPIVPFKVKKCHKDFMLKMLGEFQNPADITRMLADPYYADQYNFNIILLNPATVWKHCRKFKEEAIKAEKDSFLKSVSKIAISHKSWRLKQLLKIYNTAPDPKDKMTAIRLAAQEIGEDIDKLAGALKQSGDNHYHLHVNDDDQQQHRSNLESILGNAAKRSRFAVSEN